MQHFWPYIFGAPVVEVLLELYKYCFGAMFWCMPVDDWFTYDLFFETIMGKSPQVTGKKFIDSKDSRMKTLLTQLTPYDRRFIKVARLLMLG